MDEMHAYPLTEAALHIFDDPCRCDFTVQEVVWDDEPDIVYLLVYHMPLEGVLDA